jgi:hypothetical protein
MLRRERRRRPRRRRRARRLLLGGVRHSRAMTRCSPTPRSQRGRLNAAWLPGMVRLYAARARSATDKDKDKDRDAATERPKAPVKMEMYRINMMGGPRGADESPTHVVIPRARNIAIMFKALARLMAWVEEGLQRWREAGAPAHSPPFCTNLSGGSEAGEKQGGLHLQYTGEYWDKAGLSIETVKQHVKAQIQPLGPRCSMGW